MQKRDTATGWKCYHCERPVIDHDNTVVVTVNRDFAFFHIRCYNAWRREMEKEHHYIGTLEEGFG
jgi:hypothetical protein